MSKINNIMKVYTLSEIQEIFPFGKTKLQQLLNANVLPVVKVGKDYLSNDQLIEQWFINNVGKEIYY